MTLLKAPIFQSLVAQAYLPAQVVPRVFITPDSYETPASAGVVNIFESPAPSIRRLRQSFEGAFSAQAKGDFASARRSYSEALTALESGIDDGPASVAFHSCLENGSQLLRTTRLASAIFAEPAQAPRSLGILREETRRLREEAKSNLSDSYVIGRARIDILRAFALMQHAGNAKEPRGNLYTRALRISNQARTNLDPESSRLERRLHFITEMLSLEILQRHIGLAHNSRDLKERKRLTAETDKIFRHAVRLHDERYEVEVMASYKADFATLMARMELWGPALASARTVTSEPFDRTLAARRIVRDEFFEPFVDGGRFLFPGEIKLRAKENHWLRRIRAAIAFAHSKSLKETAIHGATGMITGMMADIFNGGEHTALAGAMGAATLVVAKNLKNGWQSEEALYADEIGIFHRSPYEGARDVMRLATRGGMSALAWTVPAALMASGDEGFNIFMATLGNAADVYAHLGERAVHGAASLARPEIYSEIGRALAGADPLEVLYHVYTKGAGLLFVLSLLNRRYHVIDFSTQAAFLLPGALMLSADIGMVMAGETAMDFAPSLTDPRFLSRVGRAGIVAAEVMLIMGITGHINPRGGHKSPSALQILSNSLNPRKVNYALPIAGAIATGITSPLGGIFQGGLLMEDIPLSIVQGVSIALCLTPLAFTLNGILRSKIPLVSNLRESLEDSRDNRLHVRARELIMSGADAFMKPYAVNRTMRIFTWDLIPTALRTFLGWDTNAGQAGMSSTRLVMGNSAASATWPEASSTVWERRVIELHTREIARDLTAFEAMEQSGEIDGRMASQLRREAMRRLHRLLESAGQVMHPFHPFMEHHSTANRMWPLYSFTRPMSVPDFPHVPNVHLFANLLQMLNDGHVEKLDADQLEVILEYARWYASKPNVYDVVRPLIKTLAMARGSAVHGERIGEFLRENSWILDVLDVELGEYTPPSSRYRRAIRKIARGKVARSFVNYEKRILTHGRQGALDRLYEGLFQLDGPLPSEPTGQKSDESDADPTSHSIPPANNPLIS